MTQGKTDETGTMARISSTVQQADARVSVFKTRLTTCIGEVLFATFVSLPFAGTLIIFLWHIGTTLFRSRITSGRMLGVALLGSLVPVIVWLWWKFLKDRLKFTLRVTPHQIQFGGGIFRETFWCDDIDVIRVAGYEGECLKVGIPGRTWTCYLKKGPQPCADLLREYCPNAVYIDAYGREHLPGNASDPVLVVKRLVESIRRRGRWAIGAGVLLAFIGLSTAPAFLFGKSPNPGLGAAVGVFELFACAAFGFFSIRLGRRRLHKAERIMTRVRQLAGGRGAAVLAKMTGKQMDLDEIERILDEIPTEDLL